MSDASTAGRRPICDECGKRQSVERVGALDLCGECVVHGVD